MKKFRGMEVWRENDNGAMLCYSQWELGNKYKIYVRRDGVARYYISFATMGEASIYFSKMG